MPAAILEQLRTLSLPSIHRTSMPQQRHKSHRYNTHRIIHRSLIDSSALSTDRETQQIGEERNGKGQDKDDVNTQSLMTLLTFRYKKKKKQEASRKSYIYLKT